MARRRDISGKDIEAGAAFLRRNPKVAVALIVIAALVALGFLIWYASRPAKHDPSRAGPPGTYLFCSWNVENFFDDQDDPKNDDRLEDWFAHNPDKFRLKADRLADGLLRMNDGRGPDIIALCEVETENSMNALKSALNDRLDKAGKGDQKFEHILFKIDNTGRRFAPAIITRLPVVADRTHKFAKHPNGRTLEGHIRVNGYDLAVLSAHWTSRVEPRGGGRTDDGEHPNADRRMSYARDCYGRFRAIIEENPDAEVILCGDFNDEFRDASMQTGLRASANPDEVRNAAEPRPLALFANLPAGSDVPGTIYYDRNSTWSTFDHICVSRGLLDEKGWACEPDTAAIFAPPEFRRPRSKVREPFKFGNANTKGERGYSDHFPVTVRLKVQGNEGR